MKQLLLVITFLLSALPAQAFDMWGDASMLSSHSPSMFNWYVDSVNGNDANSGKTQSQAFKTISALSGRISAGSRIGLARGSQWREQLTLPAGANNVTISAYGTGERPLLNGSDIITGWVKTASQTYVYEKAISLAGTATIYTNCWENDTRMVRVASVSACNTTPGTYYLSEASVNTTIYIHPYGDTNATSDDKTREVTIRNYGLLAEYLSGTAVNGIWTTKSLSQNGSLFVGLNSTVRNCRASWGNKHNLFVRGGSLVEDTTVDEAYYGTTSLGMVVYYEDTATGGNVTFRRVNVSSTTGVVGSGIMGHISTGGTFGTVTAENCTISGLGTSAGGFNMGAAQATVVSNCTVTNCGTGVSVGAPITINDTTISAINIGVTTGGTVPVTINRSNITVSAGAASCVRSTGATASTINIYDSTLSAGGGWMIQIGGTGAVMNFQRNTYSFGGFGWYDLQTAGYVITSDYNTFVQAGKGMRLVGVSTTYANWKLTGQDAHSTP